MNAVSKYQSSTGKKPQKYPDEIKTQAVEMFQDCRKDFKTRTECAAKVAGLLGVGSSETVLNWVRQSEVDAGQRLGTTTAEMEEIRRLKRENAELRRANGILKAASAFFAAEFDRPQKI
jgi:transposase